MVPKISHQYLTKMSDRVITNSVGAGRSAPKLVNSSLNAGITKIMITAVMMNATTMHRDRVEQRRLDLALDGEDLFLVGRQAVQQAVEDTGRLAGGHQVAVQLVEVQRVLAESLVERAAGFHLGLDVEQQPAHRRVGVALADDIEGLQQRHPGLHHGGKLAREQRDVLLGDLAAHAGALALDLERGDALAAQRGLHHRLAARPHVAA